MVRILIILIFPLVTAGIYIGVLSAKMKSVAEATRAGAYVNGKLNLTKRTDHFRFATQNRVKISNSSSSGGGSRSGGSGGFSETGRSFLYPHEVQEDFPEPVENFKKYFDLREQVVQLRKGIYYGINQSSFRRSRRSYGRSVERIFLLRSITGKSNDEKGPEKSKRPFQ